MCKICFRGQGPLCSFPSVREKPPRRGLDYTAQLVSRQTKHNNKRGTGNWSRILNQGNGGVGSGEKPIRRRKPLIKSCMLYRLHQFYFSSATARAHNFPERARVPAHIPGQLPSVSEKSPCPLAAPRQAPHSPRNKKNNNSRRERLALTKTFSEREEKNNKIQG